MKDNNRQSNDFTRAHDMIIADKYQFEKDKFSQELFRFLSARLQFEGLSVQVVEGKTCDLIISVNVKGVKKSRTV